jgi:alkanesulfonate monooxygenase SsuD/methylene tetrahydromethanopterin reductase-like flavin-dependent oxidoreductase (luciferase family)
VARVGGIIAPVLHALYVAPFEELSDPAALLEVAVAAEEVGWDGMFLWDHVLRPAEEGITHLADTWSMLAAIAVTTTRLRIGPMVTPPSRRRIAVLAKQSVTVDHLSDGRLTLGLGLGVDSGGELSRFGEVTDPVERGAWLDEAADALVAAWTGEPVVRQGRHVVIDDVRFLPRPVQEPRIPLWFAARGDALRPVRRAAAYDGLFAIEVDRPRLERMLDEVRRVRGDLDGFDVAIWGPPDGDPELLSVPGVTWTMCCPGPKATAAEALAFVAAGPPDA